MAVEDAFSSGNNDYDNDDDPGAEEDVDAAEDCDMVDSKVRGP